MPSLSDIRSLGYTVAIAHGSVEIEEDALAAARAAADLTVVTQQANDVTNATIGDLDAAGKLPETPQERLELAQKIAASVLGTLVDRATAAVAFHERALEAARSMPDVWRVEQLAGDSVVLSVLVAMTADGAGWDEGSQELLDALADPDTYAERQYQGEHPAAMAAAAAIAAAGVEITRPTPGADIFDAEGRTFAAADLEAFLEEVRARPPSPTTQEKVAAALADAPELSEATRQALIAALQ